jgi:hypothetical protein
MGASLLGRDGFVERNEPLNRQGVLLSGCALGVILDFVIELDELEAVGAEAGGGFQAAHITTLVGGGVARAEGEIPARIEDPFEFEVTG